MIDQARQNQNECVWQAIASVEELGKVRGGAMRTFLYSQQLDEAFHHSSLLELCRVAKEDRVFPLLAFGGAISPHLETSVELLCTAGHKVSIQRVNYEFLRGACEMLRIQRADWLASRLSGRGQRAMVSEECYLPLLIAIVNG